MSPTTRRHAAAADPNRKPSVCSICGKAGAPTSSSSDMYHEFVSVLSSRSTILDFLAAHAVVEPDLLSEAGLSCGACTVLIRKTDRLHAAYEKSLLSLKRKHVKFKAKGGLTAVFVATVDPIGMNGTNSVEPAKERGARKSRGRRGSVDLKTEAAGDGELPAVLCEIKEEHFELPDEFGSTAPKANANYSNEDEPVDLASDEHPGESQDAEQESDDDDDRNGDYDDEDEDDEDWDPQPGDEDADDDPAKPRRKCRNCSEEFPFGTKLEKKNYYDHLRRERQKDPDANERHHHRRRRYECDRCEFNTKKRDGLVEHFGKDHPGVAPFPCEKCEERFATRELLRSHKSSKHSKLVCDCCGKKFSSTGALHMHKGLYDYSGICEICGKFSPNIKQHKLKMHKNTLPTPCRICGMMCRNVRHRRVHECEAHGKGKSPNVKKRWTCTADGCEVWFTEKHSLARHMSQAHGTKLENAESFTCEHCGKEFFNPKSYREHINGHLGLKPHVCPICAYATNISSNLHLHLKQVHRMTLSVARQNMQKGSPPALPLLPTAAGDESSVDNVTSQPVMDMDAIALGHPAQVPQPMETMETAELVTLVPTYAALQPVIDPKPMQTS